MVRSCAIFSLLLRDGIFHVSSLNLSYQPCSFSNRITRHENALESMLATWLLPIVPLVVISTTGGIIAPLFDGINPSLSLLTIIISSVALFIGLAMSFMVITMYLLRLIAYGLPPKGFIVSKFLPLGPLGQVWTICAHKIIDDGDYFRVERHVSFYLKQSQTSRHGTTSQHHSSPTHSPDR